MSSFNKLMHCHNTFFFAKLSYGWSENHQSPAHPKDAQWGWDLDSAVVNPCVKMMSHALWTTLWLFDCYEIWHCHLGICLHHQGWNKTPLMEKTDHSVYPETTPPVQGNVLTHFPWLNFFLALQWFLPELIYMNDSSIITLRQTALCNQFNHSDNCSLPEQTNYSFFTWLQIGPQE